MASQNKTPNENDLQQILEELQMLRGEVSTLRAQVLTLQRAVSVKSKPIKHGEIRVYTGEIAIKFGVCPQTVRNMQGEFADLFAIHQRTETGRFFWLRSDYEKFLKDKNLTLAARFAKRKGLIRRK